MSVERKKPDYSKCVIYKLYCKDETIKEIYVGHSTNVIKRYSSHFRDYKKKKSTEYKYKFIRENSSFENWSIEILEFYPCKNLSEATQREQYWINRLGATLNKINAYAGEIKMEEIVVDTEYKEEKEKIKKKLERYLDNKEKVRNLLNNKEELDKLHRTIRQELFGTSITFVERNKSNIEENKQKIRNLLNNKEELDKLLRTIRQEKIERNNSEIEENNLPKDSE